MRRNRFVYEKSETEGAIVKKMVAVGVIAILSVLPIVPQQSEKTPRKLDGMNLLKACEGP
jgi:hypothetical protein